MDETLRQEIYEQARMAAEFGQQGQEYGKLAMELIERFGPADPDLAVAEILARGLCWPPEKVARALAEGLGDGGPNVMQVLAGLHVPPEEIARALYRGLGWPADEVARELSGVDWIFADDVARALHDSYDGAGLTADEVARALHDSGVWSSAEVAQALVEGVGLSAYYRAVHEGFPLVSPPKPRY